jgi:molybdopterin biosynthesis enzyme
MLKTISAALLAVSVIAAPALAAGTGKTTDAPASKTAQTTAPVVKQPTAKTLSANAKTSRHHRSYARHHRHQKMGALKQHATPKVALKRSTTPAKRG